MPQYHEEQHGMFHVTTATHARAPWCTQGEVAQVLIDNLYMTRTVQRAKLHAFSILPDHLHVLLTTGPKGLSVFMHSFKKNGARDVNNLLGIRNTRWQKGYHDELIHDADQAQNALIYVQENAIKHGLVEDIEDWPWTSLHFPELIDDWDM